MGCGMILTMSTIFTKIIHGEIPCAKLFENETWLAFLDVRPIARGHALLIPKQETNYIFDLEEDLLSEMLTVARPVAKAIEAVVPCKRIGLMVAGLEVPHCHLHLVPIQSVGDLNFAKAKPADPQDLQTLAAQIRARLP